MKVGDIVKRHLPRHNAASTWEKIAAERQLKHLGLGLVLSKQMGGSNPVHPCITVYYPRVGKMYDIAESLMEVVCEL